MAKKTVDSRIHALIRNGLQERKRSFFVVVGDEAKSALVNLHFILSSMDLHQNKSVLWAYKKKLLGFTSHRRKRENKIKKEIKRGLREANSEDAFELFLSLHDIRYCYYKETEKILGQTFGMCVLQDFEAVTPNTLARTIETVEGGGLVVLLLKGMSSLKQLYTLTMDCHARFRTEAHDDVVARFNERFILSLGGCESCLVIDDELNVLPISSGKSVKPLPPPDRDGDGAKSAGQRELEEMGEALGDTMPVGPLVKLARTRDQAKALLTFVDAIAEKTLRSTVSLTAARGRGKSAALGLAVAAAVAHGYSNIFLTSPSPENLKTVFEFVFKGFDALGYQDHADYSIVQSTNPDFNKAIVRVNVYRDHRQTLQYVRPQDSHVLGQAELVVIDEAAAIPLPLVKKLMGPYLCFLSSTVSGYEGTGRSLSLKLLKQLREQSLPGAGTRGVVTVDRADGKAAKVGIEGSRSLREVTLDESIRYAPGDKVEEWLNTLLCLNATLGRRGAQGCPDPNQCQLLHVNRDTLFSFHPVSEAFLQQMVALYVTSHYKNQPDDLQLMSDAPAHELFVLTAPITEEKRLPEPLCVVQVCLEGQISRHSIMHGLSRGQRPAGDLIPWLVSQQFQDDEFGSLSGARVVRIATHPDLASMGYGSRALQLLVEYFEGKVTDLSEQEKVSRTMHRVTEADLADADLLKDEVKVRDINQMPPLFARLAERRPERLDYLGVSYGHTRPLHRFWKRSQFVPVYLRQTANELTGEHTCVMLRPLDAENRGWLGAYANDFDRRFLALLSSGFRHLPAIDALSIHENAEVGARLDPDTRPAPLTKADLDSLPPPHNLTPYDHKRLESYANGLLDYHVVLDRMPVIADLYFTGRMRPPAVHLAPLQQAILLAVGLQRKDADEACRDLGVQSAQLLAMLTKTIRKVTTHFAQLAAGEMGSEAEQTVTRANAAGVHDDEVVDERFEPLEKGLDEELEEAGDEELKALRRKQRELIDALPLDQYEIEADPAAWDDAEKRAAKATKAGQPLAGLTVSVKEKKKAKRKAEDEGDGRDGLGGGKEKRHKGKKSKKERR